jgi:hypothetical protein
MELLNESCCDYLNFVENCPRNINREWLARGGEVTTRIGAGLTILGAIFAPFTAGLSLIPRATMLTTGVGATITSGDVGPDPKELSEYLTKNMNHYRVQFSGYSSQNDYEKSIAYDIQSCKYPRIVLIVSGTFSIHYLIIIGVRLSSSGNLLEAVLLDTDSRIAVITGSKLRYWLDRNGYANLILDGQYNEFFKNNKFN